MFSLQKDVFFYLSDVYREVMIDTIVSKMNEEYEQIMQRFPTFRVMIVFLLYLLAYLFIESYCFLPYRLHCKRSFV